jgi:hypothetical protein
MDKRGQQGALQWTPLQQVPVPALDGGEGAPFVGGVTVLGANDGGAGPEQEETESNTFHEATLA